MIDRRAIDLSAPNLMSICIDDCVRGNEYGRCYDRYSAEPESFPSLNVLLLKMDYLMDRIDFPQASSHSREFFDKRQQIDKKEAERMRDVDDILNRAGEKATFVVNIKYRQKIFWAEAGRSCNFRSALEMLKLIDGALQEGGEVDEAGDGESRDASFSNNLS